MTRTETWRMVSLNGQEFLEQEDTVTNPTTFETFLLAMFVFRPRREP